MSFDVYILSVCSVNQYFFIIDLISVFQVSFSVLMLLHRAGLSNSVRYLGCIAKCQSVGPMHCFLEVAKVHEWF